MIFQHTWEKVLSGEKTQTRRLVKLGQYGCLGTHADYTMVADQNGRWVYQVGKDYAVQPGRGKPAVARIRITDIRREDVRYISEHDVCAEGFETSSDFFMTWCKMHDKGQMLPIIPDYFTGAIVWQGCRSELLIRPAERYQAWILTFCLVE